MGTDIHLYAEKKNKSTGKWEIVKGKDPDIEWYKSIAKNYERQGDLSKANKNLQKSKELENKAIQVEDWLYSGRNYDLFSILADVRNGYGFAGIPTGEGFNPIAKPKGVPSDASEEYKEEVEYWEGDGHSHSWLTLKELNDYDWNQTTALYGVVSELQYKELKKTGKNPTSYASRASGGNIVTVSTQIMDRILDNENLRTSVQYYVKMEWEESYKEAAGSFYPGSDEFNSLKELSEDENLEDVRIVFFFDN